MSLFFLEQIPLQGLADTSRSVTELKALELETLTPEVADNDIRLKAKRNRSGVCPNPEPQLLANLERAKLALAEARNLPDVLQIRDKAVAARTYAKAAKLSREAQHFASEVYVLACHRAGEILRKLDRDRVRDKHGRLQADSVSGRSEYSQTLEDSETDERTAQRWQQLAEVPMQEVEKYIAACREKDKDITAAELVRSGSKNRPGDPRLTPSPNGHDLFTLKSWLQKAIRRGLEEDAVYCAVELDLKGTPGAVWGTIFHCVSEDIGLAEPGLHAEVDALYTHWKNEQGEDGAPERLYLIHAVLRCVHARKNRRVDNILNVFYNDRPHRHVPDWVKDKHTKEGQKLGRGFDHFFEEGARLENEFKLPGDNELADRARQTLITITKEKGEAA